MNQTNNKEPPESAVKVQSAPCEDSRGTELQTIPESRYAPPYTAHDGNLCREIVVFESGTESLVENTKALFKHNIEVQARRECETSDRSQQMCL